MCKNCHVVSAKTKLTRTPAVVAAMEAVGGTSLGHSKHQVFGMQYREGFGIKIPGMQYTVVVGDDGTVHYDPYRSQLKDFHRFLQLAAVEQDKIIAGEEGYGLLSEEVLEDGSISLLFDDHAEEINQQYT